MKKEEKGKKKRWEEWGGGGGGGWGGGSADQDMNPGFPCLRLVLLQLDYDFLPAKFNKFTESKCYFLGNCVLFMKLPLTTRGKVPSLTPGHGCFFSPPFPGIKLKYKVISEWVFGWKFPVLFL